MKKAIPFIFIISIISIFSNCTPNGSNSKPSTKERANNRVSLPACPECVTTSEAAKMVGKVIKVSGIVKKVTHVDWEKGKPWFIDLDEVFPNNVFNIVIFRNNHNKFSDFKVFEGKKIAVTGRVKMHKFKGNAEFPASQYPQIELKNVEQIEILD